jgi:hypothetical protein
MGELRRVVKESADKQEFKAKMFGSDETKKTNEKAYSDIARDVKSYDGGLSNSKSGLTSGLEVSDNRGMHDLRYDSVSKPFQDKVKSQMKGYVSSEAERLHKGDAFGNAKFDVDGNIVKAATDHAKKMKDGHVKASEIGLTGREISHNDYNAMNKTIGESKKVKRLSFKNTRFINEEHVVSRVPDELKTEGNKFIMRDSDNTEYLVEWHASEPRVTKKLNMEIVSEQKERIKDLWNYNPSEYETKTSSKLRLQESNGFLNVLDKARKLSMKK